MQNYDKDTKSDLRERCYKFSLTLIRLLDSLRKDGVSKAINDQLIRSGTSIGANLVEAKASSSRLEFKKFYEISLKSANETKYWIGLLRDSERVDKEKANVLLKEVTELSNMIASGILRLKGKI